MISASEIHNLLASRGTVVGNDVDKIGKVSQVFLDDQTGDPEWVTVNTGLFGTGESFVTLGRGTVRGEEIVVPHDKSTVKGVPRGADANGHLSESGQAELQPALRRPHCDPRHKTPLSASQAGGGSARCPALPGGHGSAARGNPGRLPHCSCGVGGGLGVETPGAAGGDRCRGGCPAGRGRLRCSTVAHADGELDGARRRVVVSVVVVSLMALTVRQQAADLLRDGT